MKSLSSKILGALVLSSIASVAGAGPIISGDGTETCTDGFPPCTVMTITPNGAWQPNNPNGSGARWISAWDSGTPGTFEVPNNTSPVAKFFEQLSFSTLTEVTLRVWGDDTVEVFLNGLSQNVPNFSQNTCADGPLGCEPNEYVDFAWLLTAGNHTLRFDGYQIGGGPFGLLYAGESHAAVSVPEPGSLTLLGGALLLLGAMRRRAHHATP